MLSPDLSNHKTLLFPPMAGLALWYPPYFVMVSSQLLEWYWYRWW